MEVAESRHRTDLKDAELALWEPKTAPEEIYRELDFTGVILTGADLPTAKLSDADLSGVNLERPNWARGVNRESSNGGTRCDADKSAPFNGAFVRSVLSDDAAQAA
jgi:uncharacterized protein YjbI with pentapeptide repeats